MGGTDVSDVAVAERGVAVAHGMTVAELHAMDGTDDGRRWELIDGKLFVSPAPVPGHQRIVVRLVTALEHHGGLLVLVAPTDIQVDDGTIVQPDVVVFASRQAGLVQPESAPAIGLVPDIAVEVSSPSTRRLDIIHKRRLYEDNDVVEYWFVDREAEVVDVYAFGADDDLRTCSGEDRIASDLVDLDVTVTELLTW